MSRISQMMNTGSRSMMNSQTALQTVGHNIANKSTEGYSRQRVETVSAEPIGVGGLRIGTGAKTTRVTRTSNPFLEKQIQKESESSSYLNSRSQAMARVEQVYNEQMNKGLNSYMTEFFNSMRELANYPESTATRTLVRESGQALVKDFNRMDHQLSEIQQDLDQEVSVHVEEVNQFTKEIASLNEKVSSVELQGIPANDERDRRDLLLKNLAEKMDIHWAEGDQGQVTVMGAKNSILVSGFESMSLEAHRSGDDDRMQVYYRHQAGSLLPVTGQISGGALGAVLDVRDKVVTDFKGGVDELAFNFGKEVNQAHQQGVDVLGRPGIGFFAGVDAKAGSAGNIRIDSEINKDVGRIVTGLDKNASADNSVATVIANIQGRSVMNNGTTTLDDFYGAQVGRIGVFAQRANKAADSQKNVVEQLTRVRDSLSGVSLDEEATKLIEYQKAFEASARLIRTADEMLDTVINLKR